KPSISREPKSSSTSPPATMSGDRASAASLARVGLGPGTIQAKKSLSPAAAARLMQLIAGMQGGRMQRKKSEPRSNSNIMAPEKPTLTAFENSPATTYTPVMPSSTNWTAIQALFVHTPTAKNPFGFSL